MRSWFALEGFGCLSAGMPMPTAAPHVVKPQPGSRSDALSLEARRALDGLVTLLDEPELRDVLISVTQGVGQLWLDIGGELRPVTEWRATPSAVRRLAVRLIAAGGRYLDELHPIANVRLGDGIRVHAALPPVAVHGATMSIRVPRVRPLGFDELVSRGLCSPAQERWLREAVARRLNLLITGGTGVGKTTVLAALLDLVPESERVVTIEDVAELRLRHTHHVALESRQANNEGVGEIPLDVLLREALRMRPDRVVLGECRGRELATLLAALNTGHDGGAGTLHASRLRDVAARLESLGMLAELSPQALARQVVAGLHAVVHLDRTPHGGQRVAAIGVPVLKQGTLRVRAMDLPEVPALRIVR